MTRRLIAVLIACLCSAAFVSAQKNTDSPLPTIQQADSLYFSGNWSAARAQYTRLLGDTGRNSIAWNRLGYSNQRLGLYKEALANYERSLASAPAPAVKPVVESRMARVYALQGNSGKALDWLDKAVGSGYVNVAELDTSADFASLRAQERFKTAYKKVYAAAFPCSADPKSRVFDFWVGEWDVYQTGTNVLVGHSVVQVVSGGCALLENWVSTQAGNGKSLNYIDPANGLWEQDWIGSAGGPQRFLHGEYRDTAMRFVYENSAGGTKTTGHFIFYDEGPGRVRQFQDQSTDDGKTYTVSYDFTYIRKKSPAVK